MNLYLDGCEQGTVEAAPCREDMSWGHLFSKDHKTHEMENQLMIGADMEWRIWNLKPRNPFFGDVRDVRIYGRNLRPTEFLK